MMLFVRGKDCMPGAPYTTSVCCGIGNPTECEACEAVQLSKDVWGMGLENYTTEKEFRQDWVGPFLARMGFILPKHVHGQDEQGKDFFFADHDRFGHLRFYAAQAKIGNIGTGRELTELLDQIERSFEVALKYHKGAHEQRIAAVYVMTTGRISPQARERIWEHCRSRAYGENVFFLDGETLDNLERFASHRRDDEVRQLLVALLNEANYNIRPIVIASQTCHQGKPQFLRCRVLALEQALRNPLPEDMMPYSVVSDAWGAFEEINKRALPFLDFTGDAAKMAAIAAIFSKAHDANLRVRDISMDALKRLDEKYSLSLEVVSPVGEAPRRP